LWVLLEILSGRSLSDEAWIPDARLRRTMEGAGVKPSRISAALCNLCHDSGVTLQCPQHIGRPNRNVPQARADRIEDGVSDRWTDHRRRGFAEANRGFRAGQELDLELWHIAHAQWRVRVEIRVLDQGVACPARPFDEIVIGRRFRVLCGQSLLVVRPLAIIENSLHRG
jgi:hypothetical protein